MEKRTLHLKEYFIVENSVCREKLVNPVFSIRKSRFVRKIYVLTTKTWFSRGKAYFTSDIVFYSGKLSFSRENLANAVFFH